MYCTNCGKATNNKDKYCKYCGQKISNKEQENIENATEEKTTSALSMKYFNFFKKWYLPFVVIINILSVCANFNFHDGVDMDMKLFLFIFNSILYIAIPIKLINVMDKKERFGFFLLMAFLSLDYIVKIIFGTILFTEIDIEIDFLASIIILTLFYGIWYIPNMIYFCKRKNVFTN